MKVTTAVELAVGPGNIAMTREGWMFVSQHQFYEPPHPVVQVRDGKTEPFAAKAVDSVLGIRADETGLVWMLDNGMRNKTARKLVSWSPTANTVERTVDLTSVSPDDAFLNDLAVDRTHDFVYIADPANGKNAAIIVVDLGTNTAKRVLEGDASVVAGTIDLVIDGKKIDAHVGINPIALDAKDEWLYFGAMHGTKLYRVKTSELRAGTPVPEFYADRPITDGISIDTAGNIYLGDLANNALGMIGTDRTYRVLARGPELSWIDAFSYAPDGNYYIVVNQLHRSKPLNGTDATKPPFHIMRFKPLAPGRVGR
ncbi:MAG: major royal jelly family protein [Myxococcota bacterium]|nr:major royal jelly family protein [Myxococcota bacterium]